MRLERGLSGPDLLKPHGSGSPGGSSLIHRPSRRAESPALLPSLQREAEGLSPGKAAGLPASLLCQQTSLQTCPLLPQRPANPFHDPDGTGTWHDSIGTWRHRYVPALAALRRGRYSEGRGQSIPATAGHSPETWARCPSRPPPSSSSQGYALGTAAG